MHHDGVPVPLGLARILGLKGVSLTPLTHETVACPLITACRGFCLMLVDLMLTLLGCRIKHIRIEWPILERTIQSL
jgi:hypothetical protein